MTLYEEKRLPEARDAFAAIIADYDTPENRQNGEYDTLLAGSTCYLAETYFREDRFEEAAERYAEVIASFNLYRSESLSHLGLSKNYQKDYQGAIAAFAELVAQDAGSALAPQALYYQGICHELLKDQAAATTAFRAMIDRYRSMPGRRRRARRSARRSGGDGPPGEKGTENRS